MDTFIGHIKKHQKFKLASDEGGEDAEGTPFEFANALLKDKGRIHIGGREAFGQRVSVILVETKRDNKIAVIILGSQLDMNMPIGFGNDTTSLMDFIESVLPEADLKKMFGKHSLRLASGGDVTETFGKASLSMGYNKKELQVTLFVEGDEPSSKPPETEPAKVAGKPIRDSQPTATETPKVQPAVERRNERREESLPPLKNIERNAAKERSLFDGLTLIDWKPTEFNGQGEVRTEDGSLLLHRGKYSTGVTWIGGSLPTKDYEVTLEAKRLAGDDFFCGLTFPVRQEFCTLIIGG